MNGDITYATARQCQHAQGYFSTRTPHFRAIKWRNYVFLWLTMCNAKHFYCATHICIARLCCGNVSVCPSHADIVSKRTKISSNFFLGLVALPLWFLIPRYCCEILTGRGAFTRVELEICGLIKTLSNGNTVRPSSLPILFLPPGDIASRRFLSIS